MTRSVSKRDERGRVENKKTNKKEKTAFGSKKKNKAGGSRERVGEGVGVTKQTAFMDAFDVLYDVYRLFNIVQAKGPQSGVLRAKTVKIWTRISKDASWDKFIKYKLAAFMAFHTDQEVLPPVPSGMEEGVDKPGVLLPGYAAISCRKFLRLNWIGRRKGRLATDAQAEAAQEFLNSVLNSKKGMVRMDTEAKEAAVKKTVVELTTGRVVPKDESLIRWGDIPSEADFAIDLTRASLKQQIQRTVREIFKKKMTREDRMKMMFPSTSSNYNMTSGNAGTVGFLLEESELLQKFRRPGGYLSYKEKTARTYDLSPEELKQDIWSDTVRVDEGNEVDLEEEDEHLCVQNDEELLKVYAQFMDEALDAADKELPLVSPVGLLEPLKVRVISKGPPILYMVMRAIWKKMHSTMRARKPFKLIGQPDNAETMQELLGIPKGDRSWFYSGDYRGATNELDPYATECAAEAVCEALALTDLERRLLLKSLTGHLFLDMSGVEDGLSMTPEIRKQRWGQLMGSITSFPFLCIVNFAVTRWAMEVHEKRDIAMDNCPIAINGDDVVFRSTEGAMGTYGKVAKYAGLHLSVGKTFAHEYFFTINSRAYNVLNTPEKYTVNGYFQGTYRSGVVRQRHYRKSHFVNMGIIRNRKRAEVEGSGGGSLNDLVSERLNPSRRANDVLHSAPLHMRERVYREYIDQNKAEFKKTLLPWYIPSWLGGLGLPAPYEWTRTSDLDRKIAKSILLKWKDENSRPIDMGKSDTPWQVRRLVSKRLPTPITTEDPDAPGIMALQKATLIQTMDLLFDSNIPLTTLFKEVKKRPLGKILAHNRKLWNIKSTSLHVAGGLSDAVLYGPQTYDSLSVVQQSAIGDYQAYARDTDQKEWKLKHEKPHFTWQPNYSRKESSISYPWAGVPARTCKEISEGVLPRLGPYGFSPVRQPTYSD